MVIKITIVYRGGEVEECYVTDYKVQDGCLFMYQRYEETRYIPLDRVKRLEIVQLRLDHFTIGIEIGGFCNEKIYFSN